MFSRIDSLFLFPYKLDKIWQANSVLATKTNAKDACESLGSKWKVARKFFNSLECTTEDWDKNCKSCDNWRRYVWDDFNTVNDITKPCKSVKRETMKVKAGHYYCRAGPCSKCGDNPIKGKSAEGILFILMKENQFVRICKE